MAAKKALTPVETVVRIPLEQMHPFHDHPFAVRDDASMRETAESVRGHGVLTPVILRPMEGGGYEIVSGHRRARASELAGLDTVPAIIREMDDNTAIILVVDSNLQRDSILPSERAWAYRMKLEAIKRQGARSDLTSAQVGQKSIWSVEQVATDAGASKTQVQRYIRLTELVPPLLDLVDQEAIGLTVAVELSYLTKAEQNLLVETIESEQARPSRSQAMRLRKLSAARLLNEDTVLDVMMERKKPDPIKVTLTWDVLRRFFPRSSTPRQMEGVIIRLLELWKQKRQRAKAG